MTTTGTSDLSRLFLANTQNARLKGDLARHSAELSTGQLTDPASRLGAGLSRIGDLDRTLARLAGFTEAAGQTAQALATMQAALASLDLARERTQQAALNMTGAPNPVRTEAAAAGARGDFATMVAALNTRSGNLSLFSGRATDSAALADAETMLGDLRVALGGATTVADAEARVAAWFGPGGGFEAGGYLGDPDAPMVRRVDEATAIEVPVRADDPALRDLLAATALAGLADDAALALDDAQRNDLLLRVGERLLSGAEGLVQLRATLGDAEARLDAVKASQSARQTALSLMRSELTAADPFEAASRLQAVQDQLETHYALTARMARLTLADYL